MATLRDNLGYIPIRLGQELATRREEFASKMELALRERIASGEGLGSYSTLGTWYNVVRIRGAIGAFQRYRRAKSPTRRSKFGYVSLWFDQGYAEYRGVVRGAGAVTKPVNLELTGHLMANMRARAQRMAKNEGLHAWIGFRRQQRPYGKLTNGQLAAAFNERYALKPFWLTDEEADDIFSDIIDGALRDSGARG